MLQLSEAYSLEAAKFALNLSLQWRCVTSPLHTFHTNQPRAKPRPRYRLTLARVLQWQTCPVSCGIADICFFIYPLLLKKKKKLVARQGRIIENHSHSLIRHPYPLHLQPHQHPLHFLFPPFPQLPHHLSLKLLSMFLS